MIEQMEFEPINKKTSSSINLKVRISFKIL